MRRALAGMVAVGLVLGAAGGSVPAAASWAADTGGPTAKAEDAQLIEFEDWALAAGALGFYRDEVTSSIIVVVPQSKSAGFTLANFGPTSFPVGVKITDVDPHDLQAARDRLANLPYQSAIAAGNSMAYFVNPRTQKVEATTTLDADVLSALLGNSWKYIDYHYGDVIRASRTNNPPPYLGGVKSKRVGDPDPTNYCTTAFTVIDSGGHRLMVEPAHCGPQGATVQDWAGGHTMGTYGHHYCGASPSGANTDLQPISGGSYGHSIYVGGATGTVANVVEAGDPGVGASYYFSGATSFETSSQTVLSTDASVWITNNWCTASDWWELHLIAFNRSGHCDVQGGDSGAPFYVKYGGSPSTVGIRGFVVGYSGNLTTCYATKWSRIHTLMGVSIATN